MSNNKLQSSGQQGFSLVEIMVALLVFLVVMLGVAAGLIQTIRSNRENVVRDEAVRLATDDLNRLKGEQFSASGTSANLAPGLIALPNVFVNIRRDAIPIDFARLTQITDLATATALKRIDVTVGWNDPVGGAVFPLTNKNRQISLSTIIVRSD